MVGEGEQPTLKDYGRKNKVNSLLSGLFRKGVVCCCAKGGDHMGNTINELWHGNIVPQEDSRTNSKVMKELMGYIARHSEDLGKLLNEEQQELFEKYQECWNEYVSLAEAAIFEYAFKLGARLTHEALIDEQKNAQ